MRYGVTALLAVAAAGSAQTTDTVRLVPGEVPLTVVAEGKVRTPADVVTLSVPIVGSGATAAAAREAVRRKTVQVTAALMAAGVPAAAITSGPTANPLGFIGNEAGDESGQGAAALAAAQATALASAPRQASTIVRVRLTDPARLDRVEQALDAIDQPATGVPEATLTDETAARTAAVAAAVTRARAEADAYAAALGMRVTQLLAIADARDPQGEAGWTLLAAMGGAGPAPTQVETRRRVRLDVALAPR